MYYKNNLSSFESKILISTANNQISPDDLISQDETIIIDKLKLIYVSNLIQPWQQKLICKSIQNSRIIYIDEVLDNLVILEKNHFLQSCLFQLPNIFPSNKMRLGLKEFLDTKKEQIKDEIKTSNSLLRLYTDRLIFTFYKCKFSKIDITNLIYKIFKSCEHNFFSSMSNSEDIKEKIEEEFVDPALEYYISNYHSNNNQFEIFLLESMWDYWLDLGFDTYLAEIMDKSNLK